MKKILIISYFFPPANFAGSYRIASWAKYLHKFGWYPIIVTRQWNKNQSELTDSVLNNELEIEKFDTHEVHRLPYKQNLRDKLHQKSGGTFSTIIRRLLSFIEVFFQNYSLHVIPYKNLYFYSRKYLQENSGINLLLASGRPFQLFYFCSLLSKKFKLPWIADFRDEWSTCQWRESFNPIEEFIAKIEEKSERKWIKNAAAITTCSTYWAKRLSAFHNKPSFSILNGYDIGDYPNLMTFPLKTYEIVYNGTVYETQNVEDFLFACKELWNEGLNFTLRFQGITNDSRQLQRVLDELGDQTEHIVIGERVSKAEVIEIQQKADLLVMLSHENVKGNYSSKIFEYLACKRPIILFPGDNDVLEDLIEETQAGWTLKNKAELISKIRELILAKNHQATQITFNQDAIAKYSREHQTKILAAALDQVQHFNPSILPESKIREWAFKTINFTGLAKLYTLNKFTHPTVLCFHRISCESDPAYPNMQPHIFEEIIKYCVKKYAIVNSDGLFERNEKPKLLLTFDDGYADFVDEVLPVLKHYQIPALMNVVSDTVRDQNPFWTQRVSNLVNYCVRSGEPLNFPLSSTNTTCTLNNAEKLCLEIFSLLVTVSQPQRIEWLQEQEKGKELSWPKMLNEEQVIHLSKNDIEIGSHSKSHLYMPYELANGNFSTVKQELGESKNYLAQLINKQIGAFASPSGKMPPELQQLALAAGYKYLFAAENRFSSYQDIEKSRVIRRILMYHKSVAENISHLEGFHYKIKTRKNGR